MSSLFGAATEGEITHLTNNAQLINEKEVAMEHAFNGTLSVLNSTRVATNQNRKALRTLHSAVKAMTFSLRKLIDHSPTELVGISLQAEDLAEIINQVTRTLHHLL